MFAQRLRSIMREKKLSQVEIARIAKVSEATVSRYLSEQTCLPTISALINLAKSLNVSIDYLMGLTNIPTPRQSGEEFGYVLCECYARASDRDKQLVGVILNEYLTDEELSHNYDLR